MAADRIMIERIFKVEQNPSQVQKDLNDLSAILQDLVVSTIDDDTLRKMGDAPRKLVDILLQA